MDNEELHTRLERELDEAVRQMRAVRAELVMRHDRWERKIENSLPLWGWAGIIALCTGVAGFFGYVLGVN